MSTEPSKAQPCQTLLTALNRETYISTLETSLDSLFKAVIGQDPPPIPDLAALQKLKTKLEQLAQAAPPSPEQSMSWGAMFWSIFSKATSSPQAPQPNPLINETLAHVTKLLIDTYKEKAKTLDLDNLPQAIENAQLLYDLSVPSLQSLTQEVKNTLKEALIRDINSSYSTDIDKTIKNAQLLYTLNLDLKTKALNPEAFKTLNEAAREALKIALKDKINDVKTSTAEAIKKADILYALDTEAYSPYDTLNSQLEPTEKLSDLQSIRHLRLFLNTPDPSPLPDSAILLNLKKILEEIQQTTQDGSSTPEEAPPNASPTLKEDLINRTLEKINETLIKQLICDLEPLYSLQSSKAIEKAQLLYDLDPTALLTLNKETQDSIKTALIQHINSQPSIESSSAIEKAQLLYDLDPTALLALNKATQNSIKTALISSITSESPSKTNDQPDKKIQILYALDPENTIFSDTEELSIAIVKDLNILLSGNTVDPKIITTYPQILQKVVILYNLDPKAFDKLNYLPNKTLVDSLLKTISETYLTDIDMAIKQAQLLYTLNPTDSSDIVRKPLKNSFLETISETYLTDIDMAIKQAQLLYTLDPTDSSNRVRTRLKNSLLKTISETYLTDIDTTIKQAQLLYTLDPTDSSNRVRTRLKNSLLKTISKTYSTDIDTAIKQAQLLYTLDPTALTDLSPTIKNFIADKISVNISVSPTADQAQVLYALNPNFIPTLSNKILEDLLSAIQKSTNPMTSNKLLENLLIHIINNTETDLEKKCIYLLTHFYSEKNIDIIFNRDVNFFKKLPDAIQLKIEHQILQTEHPRTHNVIKDLLILSSIYSDMEEALAIYQKELKTSSAKITRDFSASLTTDDKNLIKKIHILYKLDPMELKEISHTVKSNLLRIVSTTLTTDLSDENLEEVIDQIVFLYSTHTPLTLSETQASSILPRLKTYKSSHEQNVRKAFALLILEPSIENARTLFNLDPSIFNLFDPTLKDPLSTAFQEHLTSANKALLPSDATSHNLNPIIKDILILKTLNPSWDKTSLEGTKEKIKSELTYLDPTPIASQDIIDKAIFLLVIEPNITNATLIFSKAPEALRLLDTNTKKQIGLLLLDKITTTCISDTKNAIVIAHILHALNPKYLNSIEKKDREVLSKKIIDFSNTSITGGTSLTPQDLQNIALLQLLDKPLPLFIKDHLATSKEVLPIKFIKKDPSPSTLTAVELSDSFIGDLLGGEEDPSYEKVEKSEDSSASPPIKSSLKSTSPPETPVEKKPPKKISWGIVGAVKDLIIYSSQEEDIIRLANILEKDPTNFDKLSQSEKKLIENITDESILKDPNIETLLKKTSTYSGYYTALFIAKSLKSRLIALRQIRKKESNKVKAMIEPSEQEISYETQANRLFSALSAINTLTLEDS